MKCQFCKNDVKQWDLKKEEHLIATKDIQGHIHIHGPMENKAQITEFVDHIQLQAGINKVDASVLDGKNLICPYCTPPKVIGDGEIQLQGHLVVTKDIHNHIHVHGPMDDGEAIEEIVDAICSQADIRNPTLHTTHLTKKDEEEGVKIPNRILLHNRQAFGDILMLTALVRDFKGQYPNVEVGIQTTAMHIWDHNPYVNFDVTNEAKHYVSRIDEKKSAVKHIDQVDTLIAKVGPGFLTNRSNVWNYHFANAFRMDLEQKTGIKVEQGPNRPDVWLTEDEINEPPMVEGPYWLIVTGGEPGWPVKMYPGERWQEVIDTLKDEVQFVQIGIKSHPWPHLENVIDLIGETEDKATGIRKLFKLFYHAQGTMGLVSMHMHLSAAFNNPCVVVAGAREPMWFTHYMGHQYLQTNGCLPCAETTSCWKCKFQGCMDVQKRNGMEPQDEIPPCVDIIHPQEVVEAVRKYYKGGRLKYGEKVPNKFFKNIVKTAKPFISVTRKVEAKILDEVKEEVKEVKCVDEEKAQRLQDALGWGGQQITEEDWLYMEDLFKEFKPKTVLSFGIGLVVYLIAPMVDKIIVYETNEEKLDDYKTQTDKFSNIQTRIWNGRIIPEEEFDESYDFVFVDDPPGGKNREAAVRYSSIYGKLVLVHDAGREWEKKWQEKYLEQGPFDMHSKGGHRCTFWTRIDGAFKVIITPADLEPEDAKEDKKKEKKKEVTEGNIWKDASIHKDEWEFLLHRVIDKYKVKSVLEFGPGLSTKLMKDHVESIVSYETAQAWYDRTKQEVGDEIDLRMWDGKKVDEPLEMFDLVFVDGPRSDGSMKEEEVNREEAVKIAMKHGKLVVMHDASRATEIKWQHKHLQDSMYFLDIGGRCHLWGRKDQEGIKNHLIGYENYGYVIGDPELSVRKGIPMINTSIKGKPNVRLISTARGWGGCARSITTIMKFLVKDGHEVEFVPLHSRYNIGKGIGKEFMNCLSTDLKDVVVRDYTGITDPTDLTFIYFDDYIWEAGRPDIVELFSNLQTDRKIMMLNYRRGKVGELPWTKDWDKYMFLNSWQESELIKAHPEAKGKTKVLPPCTLLQQFIEVKPNYNGMLKLIRHNSQGDTKFPKKDAWLPEVSAIMRERKDVQFHFMPGPSFAKSDGEYMIKYKRNDPPIPEFLAKGNCFYYSLPQGYLDMGPRVIVEAMAAGLPVLADNWGGATDRVTPETGWLVDDKMQYAEIIKEITPKILQEKGEAAKQRAIDNFIPERWIEEILNV